MDEIKDEVLMILIEYAANLKTPKNYWKKDLFAQQSYSIWAVKEIYREVSGKTNIPPIVVIEDFAERMDEYSMMCKETSFMFSVAYDVACDILAQLY